MDDDPAVGPLSLVWLTHKPKTHSNAHREQARQATRKTRDWTIQPWRLTSAEYVDLNKALESGGLPPWDRDFEAREKHKKLMKMVEASLDAGEIMALAAADRDAPPWARLAREANNRIVGVALVDSACSLASPSRRTTWEQRLAIHGTPASHRNQLVSFQVLDVACIGNFGEMCPDTFTRVCDVPARSPSLLPVYMHSNKTLHGTSQASLATECVETLLQMPCYRTLPFKGHIGAGVLFCLCKKTKHTLVSV